MEQIQFQFPHEEEAASGRHGTGFRCFVFLYPVLFTQPGENLIHAHMLDVGYIQFRQAAGDIVQQQIVAADDAVLIGLKTMLVIIKQIGDAVHGHRGLAAACHPLDNQVGKGGFADNGVLLFLDRGDDLPQHRVLVLGQVLHQQLVIGSHIAVIITLQSAFFHIISAFQAQVDGDGFLVRQSVLARAQFVLIVDTGNGGPPVRDQHVCLVAEHPVFADVDPLLQFRRALRVVDAAEVRFIKSRSVLAQRGGGVLFQAAGGHQLVIQFHIAAVDGLVQFLYLGMALFIFLLISDHIPADNIQAFLEVQLLLFHFLFLIPHGLLRLSFCHKRII